MPHCLVVPVSVLVMCLAEPAVSTLFWRNILDGPIVFGVCLAITYVFTAFGNLSLANFISSQGKTTFYLYLFLLQAAIGFPMGYILIMQFGVLGLIVTSLLTQIPLIIIMLYWIRKHYELTVEWRSSAKILLSSSLAAISTYFLISELGMSSLVRLIVGSVFFVFVFGLVTLVTRTINQSDIENMRGMVSGMGAIGGLLNIVLRIIEKLMQILNFNSHRKTI